MKLTDRISNIVCDLVLYVLMAAVVLGLVLFFLMVMGDLTMLLMAV